MGRALFSQIYATSPAVRTEPEPSATPYEKWSSWNAFDPDSEEFFNDAEYEAFIDPLQYPRDQEEPSPVAEAGNTSPASSESSVSDRYTPMAVGSDDPATMIADAYSSSDWDRPSFWGSDWRRARDERSPTEQPPTYPRLTPTFNPRAARSAAEVGGEPIRPIRINRPRSATVSSLPAFLPPSSLRNSTTATEIDAALSASRPRSPYSRRTVNITPINIPIEPSSPSPISPESPSTPPSQVSYPRPPTNLDTPSPAPTVTPRLYTWQHLTTSPASPSQNVTPLTNLSARMSLPRINIASPRVSVQNSVI